MEDDAAPATPPPGAALFEVLNEVGIINQLATTEFNRRLPEGLHVSHFGVINHLVRLGDGRPQQGIAAAFQVTKATMSHTIAVLTKRGLVEVRPNPKDGRSKLVFLTDRGRAFRDEAIAALVPAMRGLAARIDLDQTLAALPALRDLRAAMDEMRD